MSRLTAILLTIISLAICGASCITDGEPDNASGLIAGSNLPSFSLTMNDGKTLSSADLTGRTGVIIFFNTECSDCQRELPEMQNVYALTKDDAVWLAIAREEGEEAISEFWTQHNLSIPYSPQTDRHIYELFASNGIPRLYLTDGSVITYSFDPESIPTTDDLYQLILSIKH